MDTVQCSKWICKIKKIIDLNPRLIQSLELHKLVSNRFVHKTWKSTRRYTVVAYLLPGAKQKCFISSQCIVARILFLNFLNFIRTRPIIESLLYTFIPIFFARYSIIGMLFCKYND